VPTAAVSIRELSAHFGVKAGVVRDALLDAQGKGMIKVLPRAGAFVVRAAGDLLPESTPSQRMGTRLQERLAAQDPNLFHMISARETLEVELISLAARKCELQDLFPLRRTLENMTSMPLGQRTKRYTQLDVEFHLEIARLSGNAIMAAMLRTLMEELVPLLQGIGWSEKRSLQTDESHGRLYSALVAGNVEAAQSEVRAHLQVAYDALLSQVSEPPTISENASRENN